MRRTPIPAKAPPKPSAAAQGHDHGACVDTLLSRARVAFEQSGLKLTALRLGVLEEIASSHDAIGAYDVLRRLSARKGEAMAPISVYRAITALQQAGLVHRLESRNAYFACHAPHRGRQRHIALVCNACDGVIEVPAAALYDAVEAAGRANGFQLQSAVAEGLGTCASCQTREERA